MTIDALALLQIPHTLLPEEKVLRAIADDSVLVRVGVPFAAEPDELVDALYDTFGELLDEHDDVRGVLIIPHVANPRAGTYEGIIEEVGEGGTWVELDDDSADLGALMGEVMGMIGPDTMAQLQRAMLSGDPAAGSEVQAKLDQLLSGSGRGELGMALEAMKGPVPGGGSALPNLPTDLDMSQLQAMMKDLPFDMNSPEVQSAVNQMAEQLQNNPELLQRLGSQLFGAMGANDEEEGD